MQISTAQSEFDYLECFPVIVQLRPHLSQVQFLSYVAIQSTTGYRISYIKDNDRVVTVAGYRLSHCLAWGKFLYVDDLITDADQRSKGYGKAMLDWLISYAREQDCAQLHLDSGVQRLDAHRFYAREGMLHNSHHFAITL